jgi:hypothetical protein
MRSDAFQRQGKMDISIKWLTLVPLISAFVAGCSCSQMGQCPSITVAQSTTSQTLTITGMNFSNIPNCAALQLVGLPAPEAVISLGQPPCTNGSFTTPFQYSLSCQLPQMNPPTQTVVVGAVDQSTSTKATQTISFPWEPGCVLSPNCITGQQSPSLCPSFICTDGSCEAGVIESCASPSVPICTNGCTGHGGAALNVGCSPTATSTCTVGEQSETLCGEGICNQGGGCGVGTVTSCTPSPPGPLCTNGCAGLGGVNPNSGCP